MTKFDEFPLNVQRIKASKRYREMKDYQQAWYLNLLMEAWDSETPGYLKDNGELWLWANARTAAFFAKEGGPVLRCFHRRTIDGVPYLVNERLLEIYKKKLAEIQEGATCGWPKQNPRKQRRSVVSLNVSICSDLSLPIYEKYPRKVSKAKALTAISKAIARVSQEKHCSDAEAAKLIYEAVAEFAQSPAGQRGLYTPHPATWMNQDRFFDDRGEWYRTEEGSGQRKPAGKPDCPRCAGAGEHRSYLTPGRMVVCECVEEAQLA